MALDALHVRFDPGDFRLECLDAAYEFLDRHGIEVLLCKLDERVAGLARKEIVEVHG